MTYCSVEDAHAEICYLLALGRERGEIFAPANDMKWVVPLYNMLTHIDLIQDRAVWRNHG